MRTDAVEEEGPDHIHTVRLKTPLIELDRVQFVSCRILSRPGRGWDPAPDPCPQWRRVSDDSSPFSHVDVADDEPPLRRAKLHDGVFQGQLRDETNRAEICRWKEEHEDEQNTVGGAVGAELER